MPNWSVTVRDNPSVVVQADDASAARKIALAQLGILQSDHPISVELVTNHVSVELIAAAIDVDTPQPKQQRKMR